MSDVLDARWRVVYLLVIAVGVFVLEVPWHLLAVFGLQVLLWFAVRLPPRLLLKRIAKLWVFFAFIVGSYALFQYDPTIDRWVAVPGVGFKVNATGAFEGLLMVLRVVCVVLASQVARAGDPRAISGGLRRLRVPPMIAMPLDVVLALLSDTPQAQRQGGGGGGGGRGGGGGGGRRRRSRGADGGRDERRRERFWQSVKRLARGDVGPIVERLRHHIERAERHTVASAGEATPPTLVRDVSIVAGVALTMLAIKVLKILPSMPIAPGHKMVLLTPLYIVAAMLTRSRFGATLTGLTMGAVAFLLGDGRYGIFEILKHIAPGLICDLLVPVVLRKGTIPGGLVWSALGAAIALGRFTTAFVVVLVVQPPAVAFALLIPGLALNMFFGLMSGYVSFHVARAALQLKKDRAGAPPSSSAQRSPTSTPQKKPRAGPHEPADRPTDKRDKVEAVT